MQMNRFEPVLFMVNRFDWIIHLHTKQINRFITFVFMLNPFDRLKHQ